MEVVLVIILVIELKRIFRTDKHFDLGTNFYYNGVGTEKDLEISKFYLELASNHGLLRAIKKFQEYKSIYNNGIAFMKRLNSKGRYNYEN